MEMFYPLATSSWDHLEVEAIQKVIKTGMYTMGAHVAQYEKEFAKFLGAKYCVMCSSGSTANLLMVAALFYRKENPLKRGDEVIVPAVSWSTTYFPLAQYGLKLKFVDIDIETLNYDLNALKSAITDKTRMVMTVNLLGNPNDFSQIKKMIAGKNIELVEDNCESLGATFESRQAGTFGTMGTYSSFFSHHISTMEGGIVSTDDEELYHILLCLRAHGWTRNLPKENKVTGTKSDNPFEESFKFVLPGYNVRPLEMSGAIGLEQIKKLQHFVDIRRENAAVFQELFGNHKDFYIQKETGKSSWFGFSFVIKPESKVNRLKLIDHLTKAGVECRPIVAGNFAKNEALKWFEHEIHGKLPNAESIDSHGFFVGNHQVPMTSQIQRLRTEFDKGLALAKS
ncbi:DegT/DnrJ/EryC1/StrS family aminotransferase [Bdellovibrio sp. HCB337]|uniref:DegT/DnrJ/EryC1/StrS family aminotransferase n=1 Tax=Bdellovibrio sp. HCB337 TaxID=3394358 RepID=UPI0039A75471